MKNESDGYIPVKVRFLAWWQGIDSRVLLRRIMYDADSVDDIETETFRPTEAEARREYYDWSPDRIELNCAIWGEGFISPGGPEQAVDFVKPAGIDPSQSILDMTAGLGGGARAIADAFDMWVDGLERHPRLAESAREISKAQDMDARAGITHYDPDDFELRANRYYCIFAREGLAAIVDKAKLLMTVYQGLKAGGHFIFTDYMLPDNSGGDGKYVRNWIDCEPEAVSPLKVGHYRAILKKLGFEIRICDDHSERFRRSVMQRLKEYVENLDGAELTRGATANLMREAMLWRARVRALQSGEVKYMRIHAIKKKRIV